MLPGCSGNAVLPPAVLSGTAGGRAGEQPEVSGLVNTNESARSRPAPHITAREGRTRAPLLAARDVSSARRSRGSTSSVESNKLRWSSSRSSKCNVPALAALFSVLLKWLPRLLIDSFKRISLRQWFDTAENFPSYLGVSHTRVGSPESRCGLPALTALRDSVTAVVISQDVPSAHIKYLASKHCGL